MAKVVGGETSLGSLDFEKKDLVGFNLRIDRHNYGMPFVVGLVDSMWESEDAPCTSPRGSLGLYNFRDNRKGGPYFEVKPHGSLVSLFPPMPNTKNKESPVYQFLNLDNLVGECFLGFYEAYSGVESVVKGLQKDPCFEYYAGFLENSQSFPEFLSSIYSYNSNDEEILAFDKKVFNIYESQQAIERPESET